MLNPLPIILEMRPAARTSHGNRRKCGGKTSGFTLLELLTVMAVMSILVALVMPVIGTIQSGHSFTKSVNDLSGILESARNYAQARNTYVWLGLAQQANNPGRVYVATVASLSGESDLSGDVEPQDRVHELSGIALIPFGGATSDVQDIQASTLGSFTQKIGGTDMGFTNIVRFSPTGEATVQAANTVPHWVHIECKEVRGTLTNDANSASLQISGLSGLIKVSRNP